MLKSALQAMPELGIYFIEPDNCADSRQKVPRECDKCSKFMPDSSLIPFDVMIGQTETTPALNVASLIRSARGHRVILDVDLAQIYEVTVKRLNEQYRRNVKRFPEDFAFVLTAAEWDSLRPQIATLKTGRGGHRKYPPVVFTEHGALMAANILNSPRAVAMSVYVIRAFVKMREDLAANSAILRRLAEIDKTLVVHDITMRKILQKLRPLLQPPPTPPKPQIGFHVREDSVRYRVRRSVTDR